MQFGNNYLLEYLVCLNQRQLCFRKNHKVNTRLMIVTSARRTCLQTKHKPTDAKHKLTLSCRKLNLSGSISTSHKADICSVKWKLIVSNPRILTWATYPLLSSSNTHVQIVVVFSKLLQPNAVQIRGDTCNVGPILCSVDDLGEVQSLTIPC